VVSDKRLVANEKSVQDAAAEVPEYYGIGMENLELEGCIIVS